MTAHDMPEPLPWVYSTWAGMVFERELLVLNLYRGPTDRWSVHDIHALMNFAHHRAKQELAISPWEAFDEASGQD